MKLKDFLTKLKTDGKITQAEFLATIDAAPDFEFPDKAVEAFEASFLTPDRAIIDSRVYGKIKADVLDPVDLNLKEMLTFIDTLDHFTASDIDKKSNNTFERQKAINAAIPHLFEKVKKTVPTDDDTKKKLKAFEEANQDLLARIDKMNSEIAERQKFYETEAEKKISGFQRRMELEKLFKSIKFGKHFENDTFRNDIAKVKLDGLEARYNLQLVVKDGQTVIQVNDKEGKPLFKENSNTAVTINQLLEDELKPYIKANNVGDEDEGEESETQVTKRFKVSDDNNNPQIRPGARVTVTQSI